MRTNFIKDVDQFQRWLEIKDVDSSLHCESLYIGGREIHEDDFFNIELRKIFDSSGTKLKFYRIVSDGDICKYNLNLWNTNIIDDIYNFVDRPLLIYCRMTPFDSNELCEWRDKIIKIEPSHNCSFPYVVHFSVDDISLQIHTDKDCIIKFFNCRLKYIGNKKFKYVAENGVGIEDEVFDINGKAPITIFRNLFNYHNIKTINVDEINKLLLNCDYIHVAHDMKRINRIMKVYSSIIPYFEQFAKEHPTLYCVLYELIEHSNQTIWGVRISKMINMMYKNVKTYDEFVKASSDFNFKGLTINYYQIIENLIKTNSVFKELRNQYLKKKGMATFSKLTTCYDDIPIDEEKYPIVSNAIKEGKLPLSIFFCKRQTYFLMNNNWVLWEQMLKKFKTATFKIADLISLRTEYEKDIMSYFYFILYSLPKYLKKHTGKTWKVKPKIVTNDKNGVLQERSQLTPIVDNEKRIIEIPYSAISVSGERSTTYCYALSCNVLTSGFTYRGNVVTSEIETKLNCRDDYGLMFYTLTKSVQDVDYPTFLIIFEKRMSHNDTRVHFHRVHSTISKDGNDNPVHNWINTGYKWMTGNINSNLIKAQQGDLMFLDETVNIHDDEFNETMEEYDNHKFDRPVKYKKCTNIVKENILGYIHVEDEPVLLNHNEHETVIVPIGKFTMRQARSFESNSTDV